MKHDELRAIAHNAATSLVDGYSVLIGVFAVNIPAALRDSPNGEIIVDFLRGTVSGASPSSQIARAAALFRDALPALCEKHGISVSAFREMTARYWGMTSDIRFTVNIVDGAGRSTETEYGGYNGQRTKVLDAEGRLRPKSIRR